jgi:hypothetical protein
LRKLSQCSLFYRLPTGFFLLTKVLATNDALPTPSFIRDNGITNYSIFFFLLIEERNRSRVFVPLGLVGMYLFWWEMVEMGMGFNQHNLWVPKRELTELREIWKNFNWVWANLFFFFMNLRKNYEGTGTKVGKTYNPIYLKNSIPSKRLKYYHFAWKTRSLQRDWIFISVSIIFLVFFTISLQLYMCCYKEWIKKRNFYSGLF